MLWVGDTKAGVEGQVGLQQQLQSIVLAQRGHLFGWVPVGLACGIGWYFTRPIEPDWQVYAMATGVGVSALILARAMPLILRPFFIIIALVALGVIVAGARAHRVGEPVLGWRYYGPIEGRIVAIDRSASDVARLTLDRVVLARVSPSRTPDRVRISLHGDPRYVSPEPGMVVMMTGHLSPPSGPVEPGGFDFRRMAWFSGLGAVGYTRTPALLLVPADQGAEGLWVHSQRMAVSAAVQRAISGEAGAFAAAIMTGDRSAMGQDTLRDLRASNLAHLLAISGLHMGLLTGFIFTLVRFGLALLPMVALRWPCRKYAAAAALAVGAGYLTLSGGNVATERAYIMVAVMFVAVLLNRRALTLRAVAIAAIIVLALRPEALSGPGFQMSFAATTALVAVFRVLRRFDQSRLPKWLRAVGAVVISSLVAGLATAPFAAAHFNQFAQLGLIANLLSVPLMGVLVMPAAVLAVCLAPLGLAQVGFVPMSWGLVWILGVADRVAGLDGALSHVKSPGPSALPLIALAGLIMILWQGRLRWTGAVVGLCAAVLWAQTERPALLIAQSGGLIGVIGPEGRDLSKARGDEFSAEIWLENDGAPVAQDRAFARAGMDTVDRISRATVGGRDLLHMTGARNLAALSGCGGADILVTDQEVDARPCLVIDINALRRDGAVAGHVIDGALVLETVRDRTGDRLWNTPDLRNAARNLRGPRSGLGAFLTSQ